MPKPAKPSKSGKQVKRKSARASKQPARQQGRADRQQGGASRQQAKRKPPSDAGKSVRTDSLCPVSHLCGACSHIDVPYRQQLQEKQQRMADLFADLVQEDTDVRFIKGMDDPFHYRNKVISPFAPGRALGPKKGDGRGKSKGSGPRREILTGMYAAGTHKLVDTGACLLENPVGAQVVRAVKQLMGRFGIEPYDEDAGTGFMRHVMVRIGHTSGEVLVTLVTNDRQFPGSKAFARELVKKVPAITTVVQNVNTRSTNVVLGDEEHVIYGPGFILDELCGLSFRISSTSFYQVSAGQTQVLYEAAIQLATCPLDDEEPSAQGLLGGEVPSDAAPAVLGTAAEGPLDAVPASIGTAAEALSAQSPVVLDAYCGTGTIGLVAASRMEGAQVIGVDSVASSIADAKLNARHNGIGNAEFVANDAGRFMVERAAAGLRLDVLFMDPPRAGSDEAFLSSAVTAAPQRIVYVSCNPRTQARDVAYLLEHGYRLRVLQPVDMFPHTDHVEMVALLSRA